jgi:hypothetical protein
MSASEIHRVLCAVYGQNVMNEGNIREWCSMFKYGEVVSRPSVVSDDFVRSVDQKIFERRRFTISELSCELPQISRALVYEIFAG